MSVRSIEEPVAKCEKKDPDLGMVGWIEASENVWITPVNTPDLRACWMIALYHETDNQSAR
jgi:hypothetical protein